MMGRNPCSPTPDPTTATSHAARSCALAAPANSVRHCQLIGDATACAGGEPRRRRHAVCAADRIRRRARLEPARSRGAQRKRRTRVIDNHVYKRYGRAVQIESAAKALALTVPSQARSNHVGRRRVSCPVMDTRNTPHKHQFRNVSRPKHEDLTVTHTHTRTRHNAPGVFNRMCEKKSRVPT